MRSTLHGKIASKYAAFAAAALFVGCGVTIFLFKEMPHEFGQSGALVVPGIVTVCVAVLTITSISAWSDRLNVKLMLLEIDFFLLGLLFTLYFLFPRSPDRWLFALVPILGMPVLYIVVTYFSMRLRTRRSQER